jgi:hypothetical protein
VDNAATAIAWVDFWIGFCQAAVSKGTDGCSGVVPNVASLKEFVVHGLDLCGKPNSGIVEVLFIGKLELGSTTLTFDEEASTYEVEGWVGEDSPDGSDSDWYGVADNDVVVERTRIAKVEL